MKLKIGKKTYRIRYVVKVDKDDSFGECDFTRKRISVKKGQPTDEMANTVLHEILHAICDEKQLGLTREVEEEVVTGITNGLHSLISDNPRFTKKLFGELE